MQTVTVYTKPACMQCNLTKNWLTNKGVEFTVEDILDPDNLAAVTALDLKAAPVVIVSQGEVKDDEYWAGFRPDLLEKHVQYTN